MTEIYNFQKHYVKCVKIRSFFWSVFSRTRKIWTRKNSVFGHFSRSKAFSQSRSYKKVLWNYALQLYWNHTSGWVFSCKFAANFQNIFLQRHLWWTASKVSLRRFILDFRNYVSYNASVSISSDSQCIKIRLQKRI